MRPSPTGAPAQDAAEKRGERNRRPGSPRPRAHLTVIRSEGLTRSISGRREQKAPTRGTRLSRTVLRTPCRPSGRLRRDLRSSMASVACEGTGTMTPPGERRQEKWPPLALGPGALPGGVPARREAGAVGTSRGPAPVACGWAHPEPKQGPPGTPGAWPATDRGGEDAGRGLGPGAGAGVGAPGGAGRGCGPGGSPPGRSS